MTAKERLLEEAPRWSEHDAEVALRAVERERAGEIVDEWGDLSATTRAATAGVMRRLDEEELAEFGTRSARPGAVGRSEARRGLVVRRAR